MKNKITLLLVILFMLSFETVLAGRYSDEMYGEVELEHEWLEAAYYNDLYSKKDEYGYPVDGYKKKPSKQNNSHESNPRNIKISPVAIITTVFLLWFFGIFEYMGLLLGKIFKKKKNE